MKRILLFVCFIIISGFVSTVDAQVRARVSVWEVPRTPEVIQTLKGTGRTLPHPFQRRRVGARFTWEEVAEIENVTDECPANPGTVACGRREFKVRVMKLGSPARNTTKSIGIGVPG
ncbi:MAG: hypothetical protein CM1200mP14_25130 [Gammaproteobacteria bacterium]|nr:MAG: hypothetical protein CM1200mP14_25130 [Gammaproteobacteria bacterium]